MRVYVATTIGGLRALRSNGFSAPVAAHAVTAALREWYAEADAGELEYAASSAAADASLLLLVPGEPARRVVVAAEVPDSWVRPANGPDDPSSVLVDSPVPLALVVSVHLDGADAAQDEELLWYDVTELDDVLDVITQTTPRAAL